MLEKSCKRSCILQQKLCHVLQQYAAKGVGKWCFAFYHQRSSLCCNNQVVGNCVNTDFWLHKITRESHHKRELRHSLKKSFPGLVKRATHTDFIAKKELLNTHQKILLRYNAQHRHWTGFAAFNVGKQAARLTVPYLCRSHKDESPC